MNLKIIIDKIVHNREIIHFDDGIHHISSQHNIIFFKYHDEQRQLHLPTNFFDKLLGYFRLARRLLRLDKNNVFYTGENKFIIIRRGKVYLYDWKTTKLTQTLTLKLSQNVLHGSLLSLPTGEIYFGEYGSNPQRQSVPVYRSVDQGQSWEIIYEFPAGKIRHVHALQWDPISEKIWIFNGDYDGECWILLTDKSFKSIQWLGDGTQKWRACGAFFEKKYVFWGMDSPLTENFWCCYDRETGQLTQSQSFSGPIWYSKKLANGYYLIAATCEIGPGVKENNANIYLSRDLFNWTKVLTLAHDGLPKGYFKFGVIAFAEGQQTSDHFWIFGEALKKLDGKAALCRIEYV